MRVEGTRALAQHTTPTPRRISRHRIAASACLLSTHQRPVAATAELSPKRAQCTYNTPLRGKLHCRDAMLMPPWRAFALELPAARLTQPTLHPDYYS